MQRTTDETVGQSTSHKVPGVFNYTNTYYLKDFPWEEDIFGLALEKSSSRTSEISPLNFELGSVYFKHVS